MAKMVRLWTELASRSRDLAVLMTPLIASTLKKRSKSVFLSMEYLDKKNKKHTHNRHKKLLKDRGIDLTFYSFSDLYEKIMKPWRNNHTRCSIKN